MKPLCRPCRHFAHWLRWDPSRAAVRELDDTVQVVAEPNRGCAFWDLDAEHR